MILRNDIYKIEFFLYLGVWITSVLYSFYCFGFSANKLFHGYFDYYSDFEQGWSFLHRKKDNTDYEWIIFKFFCSIIPSWVITSTIISEALRFLELTKVLKVWQISISVLFLIKKLHINAFFMIMLPPFVFILLPKNRDVSTIWLINIFVMFLNSMYRYLGTDPYFMNFLDLNSEVYSITIMTMGWMTMRCVSYHLDQINSNQEYNTIDFLAYCLYLPNLITGPFILYKNFQNMYQHTGNLKQRILVLIKDVTKITFWYFFIEFCLHFVYVSAVSFFPQRIESFDSWSLYGFGYGMGVFFHLKYMVVYGLGTSFPKFENIQVPSLPICIARVHLYSDMWRYFDVGLYQFLLNYIYIHLKKNKCVSTPLLSSFICFCFIYVWHGTYYFIFLWSVLNYFAIVIEYSGKWIHENYLEKSVYKIIGPMWYRRLTCLVATPLFILSLISNFIFFAGTEVGFIFLSRVFTDNIWSTIALILILYTGCQVSTELRSRRKVK